MECREGKKKMNNRPIIDDLRDCLKMSGHPKKFFETVDEFKPYIVEVVGSDHATIILRSDYFDVDNLKATAQKLADLGYHTKVEFTQKYISFGSSIIDLEPITISWTK